MNYQDLKLYFFSGRGVHRQERELYEKCYLTWKQAWQKTFEELDGASVLFSDAFTRQDKIGGIFYNDKCVATMSLRNYEFTLNTAKDDSIFAAWDETSLAALTKYSQKVMVCSFLTSHEDYRGEIAPNLNLRNLMLYLSVKELVQSEYSAMAGTTRCNRGVNKAALATGARFITKSQMHGVDVDLVAWYRDELKSKVFDEVGDFIWSRRVDFVREQIHEQPRELFVA